MTARAILLADGPSDEPLGNHLEALCAVRGFRVRVTTPDLRRLPNPPGLKVVDRLEAILSLAGAPDIVFVHRDAEGQAPGARRTEVSNAVSAICPGTPFVVVVPVRMTEAWLLVDEQAIREVAGRPRDHSELNIPALKKVEDHPDPKRKLRETLDIASGLSGRKLKRFQQRFGDHRRLLLERLELDGPVQHLSSRQDLEASIDAIAS